MGAPLAGLETARSFLFFPGDDRRKADRAIAGSCGVVEATERGGTA